MKKLRLLISTLICMVVFVSCTSAASAKDFGVVDLNKVIENYTKAQEVTADLKVKEAELQKFVVEAQKQLKEADTPVEKKNLEEKLGEQFNIKRQAFAKEQTQKWQEIEDEIFEQIEEMAKNKNLEMVFNQKSVIVGGVDITDEVIKQLNESVAKEGKKSEKKQGVLQNLFK